MSISTTLDLAADHIRQHGLWQSGNPRSPRGGQCVVVAVSRLAASGTEGMAAIHAVADYLGARTPLKTRFVWEWNDTPGRTAVEVVAVLRAAAVIEAARESETTLAVPA